MLKVSSELLHSRDQKLTLGHPVEFRKQSAREESVEPEERNVLVLMLTKGRGLIEADIKLFEGIDWKIVEMLGGYEENLKDRERCLCRQISVLYSFRNWCINSCIAGHSR
jgi:hypothetical protein